MSNLARTGWCATRALAFKTTIVAALLAVVGCGAAEQRGPSAQAASEDRAKADSLQWPNGTSYWYGSFGSSDYVYFHWEVPWTSAQAICEQFWGGNLARLDSADEEQYLRDLVGHQQPVWIGLRVVGTPSSSGWTTTYQYYWHEANRERWNYYDTDYTNWCATRPKSPWRELGCVAMNSRCHCNPEDWREPTNLADEWYEWDNWSRCREDEGAYKWENIDCGWSRPFICERAAASTPDTSPSPAPSPPPAETPKKQIGELCSGPSECASGVCVRYSCAFGHRQICAGAPCGADQPGGGSVCIATETCTDIVGLDTPHCLPLDVCGSGTSKLPDEIP